MNTIRIINPKDGNTAKQFETILWCIKAISKDDSRKILQRLYIDKDFIAGCDGYRLHIAFNDWDYEPGMYEILTLKANEILLTKSETFSPDEYPSIWRVFPSRCQNGIPPFQCTMDKRRELDNKSYLAYHVYVNTHNCYNLKYLEDVRMEGSMQFEMDEDKFALVVASEDHARLAVVMPLKQ